MTFVPFWRASNCLHKLENKNGDFYACGLMSLVSHWFWFVAHCCELICSLICLQFRIWITTFKWYVFAWDSKRWASWNCKSSYILPFKPFKKFITLTLVPCFSLYLYPLSLLEFKIDFFRLLNEWETWGVLFCPIINAITL